MSLTCVIRSETARSAFSKRKLCHKMDCSYCNIFRGPQWSSLSANWLCSNDDRWEDIENKEGWTVAVKESTRKRSISAACGQLKSPIMLLVPVIPPYGFQFLRPCLPTSFRLIRKSVSD